MIVPCVDTETLQLSTLSTSGRRLKAAGRQNLQLRADLDGFVDATGPVELRLASPETTSARPDIALTLLDRQCAMAPEAIRTRRRVVESTVRKLRLESPVAACRLHGRGAGGMSGAHAVTCVETALVTGKSSAVGHPGDWPPGGR